MNGGGGTGGTTGGAMGIVGFTGEVGTFTGGVGGGLTVTGPDPIGSGGKNADAVSVESVNATAPAAVVGISFHRRDLMTMCIPPVARMVTHSLPSVAPSAPLN